MERRFFMNDFEQSLKEHADNFQMAPSKKVWHGIYNDLHPGKRWPSITMSLLLIFTLVVIGHLNTNNSRRQPDYLNSKISEEKKGTADVKKTGHSTHSQRIVVRKTDLDKAKEVFVYSTGQPGNSVLAIATPIKNYQSTSEKENALPGNNLKPGNNNPGISLFGSNLIQPRFNSNSDDAGTAVNIYNWENKLQNHVYLDQVMANTTLPEQLSVNHVDNNQPAKVIPGDKKTNSATVNIMADKKADVASSAKTSNTGRKTAVRKKRNDKVNWVYFGAPVVSSVSLRGQPLKLISGTNFAPALPGSQKEYKVLHNSALGMEAGAQMNYSFSKNVQFTVGAHITYSGYNILTNQVHPTPATLVLRNPSTGMTYVQSFMTHYGDGTGTAVVSIRNYSWQASIPLGLQYRFSGNKNIQFNVAADIEPSVILKSKAYILSSDGNNYINDPDIMRKWNMSSNFGAFVTFRSTKFKWQIGPNVRYQWLSTYLKDYTIKEHLIDYGVRIGISK
jgi:hypothetical protein